MAFVFTMIPLFALYVAIPTAVLCVVEYFLAKVESPWPGRALPILAVIFSVCVTLILIFNLTNVSLWAALAGAALGLVVLNIPTVLYLVIYRNTRKKFIEKKNMDRMNIQDL